MMDEIIYHINHLLHFDGVFHWCFIIALLGFFMGGVWVMIRVLLPLKQLAEQASSIIAGELPTFETPHSGTKEIQQLRQSLIYMVEQIKTAQIREKAYLNALTDSQENERLRIAREIHDETIQALVLVSHDLERTQQQVNVSGQLITKYLESARRQLIIVIDDLRQLITNLRPTALEELGLATALEVFCEKYPNINFQVIGTSYEINQTQELALFRAAQEAIYNAERHANANEIIAKLIYGKEAITLEIEDDGNGFSMPQQLQEFASNGHYGLMGIRERILHLGGQLHLISEIAVGTRLIVVIPT